MLSHLERLIRRGLDYGVTGADASETRRGRMINLFGGVGLLIGVGYAAFWSIYDFEALAPAVALNGAFACWYGLTILAHRVVGGSAATWMVILGGSTHVVLGTMYFGAASGSQLFLIMMAAVSALVLRQRDAWMTRLVVLAYAALFVASSFAFEIGLLSARLPEGLMDALFAVAAIVVILVIGSVAVFYRGLVAGAVAEMHEANERTEELLRAVLPAAIARRLKERRDRIIADYHPESTVLFADIIGFTARSATMAATQLVANLNDVFAAFDELVAEHGLEKIKTIGDAYMVAGGLPTLQPDHVERTARLALDMQAKVTELGETLWPGLQIRVGIHTGPTVAGVIGRSKFAYDVWGDTVNMASRMETNAAPGEILVSYMTYERLADEFELDGPMPIQAKGKGMIEAYRLIGPKLAANDTDRAASPSAGITP